MAASTIESEYLLRTEVSALVSNCTFLSDFSGLGPKGDFVNFFFEAFIRFTHRVLGSGFWVQGSGFWVLGSGFWVLGSGFRVLGSGFWVLGSGFRVQGSGFWVQGSGFWVQGSGFWVQGSKVRKLLTSFFYHNQLKMII
jgi:hypothetical protein